SVRPDVIHYHTLSLLGLDLIDVPSSALKMYTAHDYWVRCPRNDLFKFNRRLCEKPTCLTCLTISGKPPQLWRYRPDGLKPFDALDVAIAPSDFLRGMIAPYLRAPVVHIPNFAPDPNPSAKRVLRVTTTCTSAASSSTKEFRSSRTRRANIADRTDSSSWEKANR